MTEYKSSTVKNPEDTLMFQEAKQASAVVSRQIKENSHLIDQLVEHLADLNPRAIVTCARGSSDHAATFAKYLFETRIGLLTSSAAPSVNSIYEASQDFRNVLYIAISQSGKSPDLINSTKAAKAAGAYVLALANKIDSPLAEAADLVLPLHAGLERSIAATKSYICTLTAILHIVAYWQKDTELIQALASLPDNLHRAWELDWTPAIDILKPKQNLYVIGRGLGFGIAQEAALKFKETCNLHAEAFSAAEVKHGPMAIIKEEFPLFIFSQEDSTRPGIDELVTYLQERKANILFAGEGDLGSVQLPVVKNVHSVCAPILAIQSFYKMINSLAIARGFHPDQPPHLQKVTETT